MTGWLGVVSRAHVQRGVSGGFAQVCHGKAAPLRRMQTGDWLIYYSPSTEMGGEALRRGHLKLSPRDVATIAGAMGVTLSVAA